VLRPRRPCGSPGHLAGLAEPGPDDPLPSPTTTTALKLKRRPPGDLRDAVDLDDLSSRLSCWIDSSHGSSVEAASRAPSVSERTRP
jgi:hypothetical protein